jgi:hypothetical protein
VTIFNGGPANGKVLMLKRSPLYLRVTQNGKSFDALDQLTDEPKAGEKVFAYERIGEGGMMHVNSRKGGGGFFTFATYGFIEAQPVADALTEQAKWRQWCQWKAKTK